MEPFVTLAEAKKIAENVAKTPEGIQRHEQKTAYIQQLVIQNSRAIAEQLALIGLSAVYLNDEIVMGDDGIGAIIEEIRVMDATRIGIIDYTDPPNKIKKA